MKLNTYMLQVACLLGACAVTLQAQSVVKVYCDITVKDTTIRMVRNSVPIQLGWGNYSACAVGTFKNRTILGNREYGAEGNAIISGRQGRYDVTVNIDGCRMENPKGTLVSLREDSMTLRGAITNGHIRIKGYADQYQKGKTLLTVCGSTEKRPAYTYGNPLPATKASAQ